jgi:DUF4097 and DUF4098 domain-containing protein YvlB
MGKRELLLIVCFVIVGVVVYQATAPPSGPNDKGFSFSRIIEAARREIRGNRARVEVATTSTIPVDAAVTEVRVVGPLISDVQITGEDRPDIHTSLLVVSNAYDDAEARQYANQTTLKPDRAGTSLVLRVEYPTGRHTGRQRATLALKIPSRMRARIESRPGKISIAGIAGLEATNAGGETVIRQIAGRVAVTHRGGSITIEDVATLKFTGRGTELKLKGVSGDASIMLEQGGNLRASQLSGPVDVESRNAEITLENLDATRGPIRVNAINGEVSMSGIKSETRVDGRNAELDITMAGAAPIAIYSEGEKVALTPPPGGFRLDAVVLDGQITPEALFKSLGLELVSDAGTKESRVSGAARGGGPTITVRTTRGDLILRERDAPDR